MKVKELMELLKDYPADAEVVLDLYAAGNSFTEELREEDLSMERDGNLHIWAEYN